MENILENLLINSTKENTPEETKKDKVFDYNNKNAFCFTLTKELVQKLKLREWFASYKKEALVSTAGIRGPQNIVYPHDTRFPINTVGITLATLAKSLVLKEKYPNKKLVKLCASEVRYNSKIYVDIISRIQSNLDITTLNTPNRETIPIWLASFLAFKLDLVGAEYITSSHGISVKNATKDLNDQGSQFLPDESMQFVNKMEEILNKAECEGKYEIEFAAAENKNINTETMEKLNNGIDLYIEYLKKGVGEENKLTNLKAFDKKIIIDSVGGCSYRTLNKILEKLDVSDKFDWLNTEEDPFFHSIGKEKRTDKNGCDILYDWSLDTTVVSKDNNGDKYFPVIKSMKYDEKLKNYPINTAVLITDPDHDRLNIVQISDKKDEEEIKKAGIDYMELDSKRILCVFSANQSFLMIMDFWTKQLKLSNTFDKHPRFIIKTTASSKSWDEWAKFNDIKVVNTPVGFKEIANIIKKVEAQISKNTDDVIVEDVFGKKVHLGKNPRVIFAGEESGGMIIGSEEMIVSHNGREALAMREKSASEAIIIASSLISNLDEKPLWQNLKDIYNNNEIIAKYDVRQDISYYNESETNIEKLKIAKSEGEIKRSLNDLFYLALAIGKKENKLNLDNIKEILSSTFKELDFSTLEDVKFVGDGTYLNFSDKFIEIRPSGTDAKTKAYGGGDNKEDLLVWTNILGNYNGEMNEIYTKYLSKSYVLNVKENSFKYYSEYTNKDANNTVFEVKSYDYLLNP